MIRHFFCLLTTVLFACSPLVSTSAKTSDAPDAATTFWRNWTVRSNINNFHLESLEKLIETAEKYNFPKNAIHEMTHLIKQCRERVEAFEEIAIAELRTKFTEDQLRELNALIQTDIGKYFLIDKNFLFTLNFVAANYDAAEVKRFRHAKENGLVKTFNEKTDELLDQLRERGQFVINDRNAKRAQVLATFKKNDPRNVLAEPVNPSASPETLHILTPPSSAVAAYIEGNRLPTGSYDLDFEDSKRRIGDKLYTLVSFGDGKLEQQWIMTFEVVEKDEAEAARSRNDVSEIKYTNLGNKFIFTSDIGAIKIETIGPFETSSSKAQPNVPTQTSRKILKSDFLTIGLYDMAAFVCRFNERKAKQTFSGTFDLHARNKPFDFETIQKTRESAKNLKITQSEERSYAGYFKALWQFYQVASHTDELRSIMLKVMKLPSIFTLVTKPTKLLFILQVEHFQAMPELDLAPSAPVISAPFVLSINDKTSLFLRLFVAPPPTTPTNQCRHLRPSRNRSSKLQQAPRGSRHCGSSRTLQETRTQRIGPRRQPKCQSLTLGVPKGLQRQ